MNPYRPRPVPLPREIGPITFGIHRSPRLSQYTLKLFITGSNPRTEAAIANLRRICDEDLKGRYSLEIVDVLENPEAAENERVLATPTLIKQLPPPLRRVIGDMSDRDKVLLGLEVMPGDLSTRKKP